MPAQVFQVNSLSSGKLKRPPSTEVYPVNYLSSSVNSVPHCIHYIVLESPSDWQDVFYLQPYPLKGPLRWPDLSFISLLGGFQISPHLVNTHFRSLDPASSGMLHSSWVLWVINEVTKNLLWIILLLHPSLFLFQTDCYLHSFGRTSVLFSHEFIRKMCYINAISK